MNANDVWKFLLEVLKVGGTSAALVFALVRWFGDKWLDKHFETQLERLKHEQEKELEQIKHAIQTMFSRIVKIHEKEYEILPQVWFLLHAAYGKAMVAIEEDKHNPDFANMSNGDLEEFLTTSRLSRHQQEIMRLGTWPDRQFYYAERKDEILFTDAFDTYTEFNNYRLQYRIFMTKDIADILEQLSERLDDGLHEYGRGRQNHDPSLRQAGSKKITDTESRLPEVQRLIQERLCYEKA